jgi:DNA-binding response OmpR family regulator
MQKILLIDDSEDVAVLVENALSPLGISLAVASTMRSGLSAALETTYDMVIIDIGLPDGDGFELFSKIRGIAGYEKVPAIFLTGNEDVGSKISAFSLGADDYIVKPFHLLELRARVESRLKKYKATIAADSDLHTYGPFLFDLQAQRLRVQGKNDPISLTPREFKILLLLAKNSDRLFTREDILEKIWGKGVFVTNRTVDAHICYLRKKLDHLSYYIESIPGEGYRFNPHSAKRHNNSASA